MDPAAIAALGAVGGALVGATAGGVVDFALERRRDDTKAKVGARQLRMELWQAASNLKSAEESGSYPSFFSVRLDAWARYGDALSAKLSVDEYKTVEGAVSSVIETGYRFQNMDKDRWQDHEITEESKTAMKSIRKKSGEAYNALARLAELDQTDLSATDMSDESDTPSEGISKAAETPPGDEEGAAQDR